MALPDNVAFSVQDHASRNPVDFSSVCSQISKHFSENVIHDLSVPICFVFLLHLANEKVRFICSAIKIVKGVQDMKNRRGDTVLMCTYCTYCICT